MLLAFEKYRIIKLLLLFTACYWPIWGIIRWWPTCIKLRGRGLVAFARTVYYALLMPCMFTCLVASMDPFIIPVKNNLTYTHGAIEHSTFILLLLTLAAIFVALASQQAAYVNRLYTHIKKYNKVDNDGKEMPVSITAAYCLVAAGFWAFSFAVLVVFGLIGQYLLNGSGSERFNNIYGTYEWAIALLFIGGWGALIAGALRHFPSPKDT